MKSRGRIFALLLILYFGARYGRSQRSNYSEWINKLLDPKKYDPRIRPHYQGAPVDVTVAFHVLATNDVDLSNMDYTIEFYLKQEWFDDRLVHSYKKELVVDTALHRRLWLPDSYVVNAKKSNFHRVTMLNRLIKIDQDGKVHFNVRLSVRASCPVDLRMFPWDVQSCPLILESYGYSVTHIRYFWSGGATDGKEFARNVKEMAQYTLQGVSLDQRENAYALGNWSTLTAKFKFKRLNGFYLLQTIGPSVIIVIISWISFIIEPDQHPARTYLGITSILTMAAIQQFINNSLPKVSYIKIIDIYSIACYLFVYLVLLEYAVVLLISERIRKEMRLLQAREKDSSQPMLRHMRRQASKGEDLLDRIYRLWWHFRLRIRKPIFCFKNRTEKTARRIDEVCRVMFPFCFIVFNALFWTYVNLPVTREMRSDEPP